MNKKIIGILVMTLLITTCVLPAVGILDENEMLEEVKSDLFGDLSYQISYLADDVGRYSSIAIDSNDCPHISYSDLGNLDLKYAYWDGNSWNIETVDAAGEVGFTTSLALDGNDYPHISYFDYSNLDLKYAYWDGSSWNIETVDISGDVGYTNSIKLDSSDFPHISYYDIGNGDLKYAYWNGNSWNIEVVDTIGYVGYFNSIALDDDEYPHISYFDYTNGYLKYAYWDGGSWSIEFIDTDSRVGQYNSLVLDNNGNPHISYHQYEDERSLRYAKWTDSSWNIEIIDDLPGMGKLGRYTSIVLDNMGYPCISYTDLTNGDLKYAYWTGSNWNKESVDTAGTVGYYTSLALDSNNNPHISYSDFGNSNLKYAYFNVGTWNTETVDFIKHIYYPIDKKNILWHGWCYSTVNAYAQSFIPSQEILTKIELPFFRTGLPTGLKISIRDDLYGEDLTSFYISGVEIDEHNNNWYEVDFPDINLVIGQTYYIVWESEGASNNPNNNIYWSFGVDNPYVDGSSWEYSYGDWDPFEPAGWNELDFCFRTFYQNDAPYTPDIDGLEEGNVGEEQEYIINATDPEDDDISYCIDWDDGTDEVCVGPYASGEEQTVSHIWDEKGYYTIKVKAKDIIGAESDWATLEVSMPKNRMINKPILNFLQQFPLIYQLLQRILEL